MPFIGSSDYNRAIKSEELNRLIEGDQTLLDIAITDMVSLMSSYLNSRYDTTAIFAATGVDRNPILVKYAVDILLYFLYSRVQPDEVPTLRKDNFDIAERWLRRVSAAELNPPGLPVPVDGTKSYVASGGNTKRGNHLDD